MFDFNKKSLKETISGMTSDNWKERLCAEYWQVQIRLEKLRAYIAKRMECKGDEKEPISILIMQESCMTGYLSCLKGGLMMANQMQELRDKLADRDRALQSANFNLSQVVQNATIVGQLKPYPTPAYIVNSPYQSSTGGATTTT